MSGVEGLLLPLLLGPKLSPASDVRLCFNVMPGCCNTRVLNSEAYLSNVAAVANCSMSAPVRKILHDSSHASKLAAPGNSTAFHCPSRHCCETNRMAWAILSVWSPTLPYPQREVGQTAACGIGSSIDHLSPPPSRVGCPPLSQQIVPSMI